MLNFEDEIERELYSLGGLDPESEEAKNIVRNLELLSKMKNDQTSNFQAAELKIRELELKEEELKNKKKFDKIKIALEAFGIMAPICFYGIWMRRGFRFEETGSITSSTFRNLIGKFNPKK